MQLARITYFNCARTSRIKRPGRSLHIHSRQVALWQTRVLCQWFARLTLLHFIDFTNFLIRNEMGRYRIFKAWTLCLHLIDSYEKSSCYSLIKVQKTTLPHGVYIDICIYIYIYIYIYIQSMYQLMKYTKLCFILSVFPHVCGYIAVCYCSHPTAMKNQVQIWPFSFINFISQLIMQLTQLFM